MSNRQPGVMEDRRSEKAPPGPPVFIRKGDLFGTPVHQFEFNEPEMNQDLKNLFGGMRGRSEGFKGDDRLQRSYVRDKGWRSDWLALASDPSLVRLKGIFGSCLDQMMPRWSCEWKLLSWVVMSGTNDYHMTHSHSHSDWSAVYYVDAGDQVEGPSGDITFEDPRGSVVEVARANPDFPAFYDDVFGRSSMQIKPKNGLLIFFPSWLRHVTLPYKGSRPRIAISTNFAVLSTHWL